ncbi:hypothetical protein [Aliiroseovarius lamellibrachiae]|uniref:hypothetical protein n=1 Tax=Aliiroseovarius lamellibrachiae TaxID=1924933 RepID=UPI001BE0DFF4|nr:hypothetical protein [Aliiroseovarius lamellibrachiae]MBT2129978.1 hypothetical protein [Aliiroseovarius lamellibrachiae]
MRFYWVVFVGIGVGAAQAETEYWDYKDWHVAAESIDTGEDLRVSCTAWTGGDGMPSLRLEQSNGDAGPPSYYPQPYMHETAARHYPTFLQDGQRVMFEFDADWRTEGFVQAGFTEEGLAYADARAHQGDSLGLLQTMRRAGTLWVTLDGEIAGEFSMSGFTAAYGKMAEQCGFSTQDVID